MPAISMPPLLSTYAMCSAPSGGRRAVAVGERKDGRAKNIQIRESSVYETWRRAPDNFKRSDPRDCILG